MFEAEKVARFRKEMRKCVQDRVPPAALSNPADRWWLTVKASDAFLDPVFESFFQRLGMPNLMRKTDYHRLAELVPEERVAREVRDVLDVLVATAHAAHPVKAGEAE